MQVYRIVKGEMPEIESVVKRLKEKPVFMFCIGNTLTANIPDITVAGANPDLVKYTPPADVELLHYGKCRIIPFPPATPDGKPTPALITYTSLRLTGIPFFAVDCGLIEKPDVPIIDIHAVTGENIAEKDAMDIEVAKKAFEKSVELGRHMSKISDVLVIGESIPAGTTTAGAVLKALGLECRVSSSMPENPVELKRKVIDKAISRLKGDETPLEIVAKVGDPVILAVAGIACGSETPIILAGGTQMVAVANVISKLGFDGDCIIVTTKYVAEDPSADLTQSPFPVIAVDPMLEKSGKAGLRAYADGFVKEGVGAGAATLIAYVRGFEPENFLAELEKDYEKIVEQG